MERLDSLATYNSVEDRVTRGYIADDASHPDDEVGVLIPSYDVSKVFGPVHFAPRPLQDGSILLPARMDPCLVVLDDNDEADLINWWVADPTNPVNRVTQTEFNNQLNIPQYGEGALPAQGAFDGQLCIFMWTTAALSYRALGCWNPLIGASGAWGVIGAPFQMLDSGAPTALAAGTGWRKPTGTMTLTIPYHGSYYFVGSADLTYGGAEPIGGMGIGSLAIAGTGTPNYVATTHINTTGERANPKTPDGLRANTNIGDANTLTWDARFFSQNSVTITFARVFLSARPAYCYGVV